jgi:hypothetical protein
MSALTPMIIRHAEKPDRGWPGPGLTEKGEVDDKSLVIRVWHRAGAWGALFARSLGGVDFPQPQVIYAANPNPQPPLSDPNIEVSQRPFETVKPLGKKLGLKPVTTWSVRQERDLREITKLSGVVLVFGSTSGLSAICFRRSSAAPACRTFLRSGTVRGLT